MWNRRHYINSTENPAVIGCRGISLPNMEKFWSKRPEGF